MQNPYARSILTNAGIFPVPVPSAPASRSAPSSGVPGASAASPIPAAGEKPVRRFRHTATRTIAINLDTARTAGATGNNAPLVIPFDGSFIHCPWSTNSDDLVMVRLDDDSDPIPVTRHYSCSGNGYSKLTITHAAIPAATLYLVIALESQDQRLLVL